MEVRVQDVFAIVLWSRCSELPTASLAKSNTGVLWILTGTHPCDTSTQAGWWRYQSASSYVRCACAGVVVHVVVPERGCFVVSCGEVSLVLLERSRLRCRLISAKLGAAPSRSTALRRSSWHCRSSHSCRTSQRILELLRFTTVGDTLVDLTRPSLHVAERLFVRDTEDSCDIVCAVSVEHVRRDFELTTAVSHCC